jgi:hypothetical protein
VTTTGEAPPGAWPLRRVAKWVATAALGLWLALIVAVCVNTLTYIAGDPTGLDGLETMGPQLLALPWGVIWSVSGLGQGSSEQAYVLGLTALALFSWSMVTALVLWLFRLERRQS